MNYIKTCAGVNKDPMGQTFRKNPKNPLKYSKVDEIDHKLIFIFNYINGFSI